MKVISIYSQHGDHFRINESDSAEWLAKGWSLEKPVSAAPPVSELKSEAPAILEAKPRAEAKPENKKPKK